MSRATALIASLGVIALAGVGLEISAAVGEGAVDRSTVTAPVSRVVVDARDGAVRLSRAPGGVVEVQVRRHHVVNTPRVGQRVEDGVLTLRTTCALGFMPCRSDYRIALPAGVDVEIRKTSGRVDAAAVGARMIDVVEGSAPVHLRADTGAVTVAAR